LEKVTAMTKIIIALSIVLLASACSASKSSSNFAAAVTDGGNSSPTYREITTAAGNDLIVGPYTDENDPTIKLAILYKDNANFFKGAAYIRETYTIRYHDHGGAHVLSKTENVSTGDESPNPNPPPYEYDADVPLSSTAVVDSVTIGLFSYHGHDSDNGEGSGYVLDFH
jgi:hypothetical protein